MLMLSVIILSKSDFVTFLARLIVKSMLGSSCCMKNALNLISLDFEIMLPRYVCWRYQLYLFNPFLNANVPAREV